MLNPQYRYLTTSESDSEINCHLRGLSGFGGGMNSTQCYSSFTLLRFLLTEQIDELLHLFLYNRIINFGSTYLAVFL